MDGELSRATLLARDAATVVAASALGDVASRASAAVPDGDLAYARLGAVRSLQTPRYRDHPARAAASEAQQLSVFAGGVGGRRVGPPLPAPLPLARVSDALDAFTS